MTNLVNKICMVYGRRTNDIIRDLSNVLKHLIQTVVNRTDILNLDEYLADLADELDRYVSVAGKFGRWHFNAWTSFLDILDTLVLDKWDTDYLVYSLLDLIDTMRYEAELDDEEQTCLDDLIEDAFYDDNEYRGRYKRLLGELYRTKIERGE